MPASDIIDGALKGGESLVSWTKFGFAAFGLLAAWRTLPRAFRFRLVTRFFKFPRTGRVIVVCSELDDPANRQWVEGSEFIYLMKYGDMDALFEICMLLREVYPNLRLEIMSSREALDTQMDFNGDFIVIGGPDYNEFAKRIIDSNKSIVRYDVPDWDDDSSCNEDIKLFDTHTKQYWSCAGDKNKDYGYLEVMEYPFHEGSKVFLFGGCHTLGVTGAARLFKLKNGSAQGLNTMAKANLRKLIELQKKNKHFGAIFPVHLIGSTVGIPVLRDGKLFDPEGFTK
jgi:hypothetical protein